MSAPAWDFVGEVGVDAGTCGAWDRDAFPADFQLDPAAEPPTPPAAVISRVGDDIDAGVEVVWDGQDVVAVRLCFIDDVDEIEQDWRILGELDVPSGHLILADPFCSPVVPYRQELEVRPGRWRAEELYWEGDLEAVRLTWVGRLDPSSPPSGVSLTHGSGRGSWRDGA